MFSRILLNQLKPGEQVIIVVREYLITKLGVFTILAAVYFGLLFFMYSLLSGGFATSIVFIVGLFGIALYIFRTFMIWYLDVMIVSHQRLLDIDQRGMFNKTVQEIQWKVVEDVVYQQRGVFQSVFNYGTVIVKTNNADISVELHHVYNPKRIRDIISEYAQNPET